MLQRYRCPNCHVPVSYGQQFCESCGVSINWHGVSPSAPFGAKDLSARPNSAPASALQPARGSDPSDNWKEELQEKSRLWHKKLAYDPTYRPHSGESTTGKNSHRGALIVLVVLIILLAVFIALGFATHGTYFNIFSATNSAAPGPQDNQQGATSQVAGPVSTETPSSLPNNITDTQPTGGIVETQKLEETSPVADESIKPVINITALEQQVHELINQARAVNGLQPLSWDAKLNAIARGHSSDMAVRNYFNHVTPEGYSVIDRYRQGGYIMSIGCGENIFMCPVARVSYYRNGVLVKTEYYDQGEIAEVIVQGWMGSPGHRQNILSLNWKVEAIGIAISSDDKVYITEDFA